MNTVKKNQKEILKLKNTISEIKKIYIRKYHSRLNKEEDRISELEDSSIEIIIIKVQREKRIGNN